MEVQVIEFTYEGTNVNDIETQINNYLSHHDVEEVKITKWEDELLVFFFTDD